MPPAPTVRSMRYFVRFVSGPRVIADEKGVILPELDDARARAEMLRALEELLHEDHGITDAWRGWRMELADVSGKALFSISLDEMGIARPAASDNSPTPDPR
jgi:hypothetical protein